MGAQGWLGLSPAVIATLIVSVTSSLVWFIIRRQKQRYWLPILRILPQELAILPKFRWTPPPIWTWLCFLIAALAISIYSFNLSDPLIKSENLGIRRTHVLFDLSPSHSQKISIEQYAVEALDLLNSQKLNSKLSYSTTGDPTIYTSEDLDSFASTIKAQGFHRAGVKLGVATEAILQKLSELDRLVIVSDEDLASWEDLNWRYLKNKMEISWFSLSGNAELLDNMFIDEVKPSLLGAEDSKNLWNITIRRTIPGQAIDGKIEAIIQGKTILSQDVHFEPDTKSIELDVDLSNIRISANVPKSEDHITWSLTGLNEGDLKLDNEFRTRRQAAGEDALIIAPPRGEMFLEDSIFHLKTSLEVLGYQTKRIDRISPAADGFRRAKILFSEINPTATMPSFCPLFAVQASSTSNTQVDRIIGLIPGSDLNDYGELCACVAALAQAPKPLASRPAYCSNLEHRDQYVGVLQSLGAAQLGGKVDSPLGAIAMHILNKNLGLHILAFTIPLKPLRAGQISYGQLPLMIKSILEFLGSKPINSSGDQRNWPRIADITKSLDAPLLAVSNVPIAESLGRRATLDQLPPKLTFNGQKLIIDQAKSSSENDARPWIYLCLILVVLALWLEVLGFGLSSLAKKSGRLTSWFVYFLMLWFYSPDLSAGVRLNLLGYSNLPQLGPLQKDVSSRTSIELDQKALVSPLYQKSIFFEPWLWVNRPQIIESFGSEAFTELLGWMQRGGFLVVENHSGSEKFKQKILEANPGGAWKTIPPDHEIMRSFHLLVSLPQCSNQVWEGFNFDQRIAVVLLPGDFLQFVLDADSPGTCFSKYSHEQAVRIFINLMMVALATDYKKDQIHLPEILKRLR